MQLFTTTERRFRKAHLLSAALVMLASASPCLADDSLIDKGDNELDKGNFEEAIQYYRRAGSEDNIRALERLYNVYAGLKRHEEAQQTLQELIAKTNKPAYKARLASSYKQSGNFYAAQRMYEDQLSADPTDQLAMIGAGECLEATGNYGAARDYFNRAASTAGPYASVGRSKLARMKDASAATTIDADAEIGKWDIATRKTLKVAIKPARNVKGYQSHFPDYVTNAVDQWNNAGRGLLRLEITNKDPEQADIVVAWVDKIPSALGLMDPEWGLDGRLKKANILIACNSDCRGNNMPPESSATRAIYEAQDRMLREVVLHELGHALGLQHSTRSDDIMANGVFGLNSTDVPFARQLQPGDAERLVQLYCAPDTANQKMMQAVAAAVKKVGSKPTPEAASGGNSEQPVSIDSEVEHKQPIANPTHDAMKEAIFNMSTGNYARSIEQLKKVVATNPNNAQAHYLLAIAHVHLRQYPDAIKQYELVLKMQPKGQLADLAAAGLSKIKH